MVGIVAVLAIGVLALGGVRSTSVSTDSGPALTTASGTQPPVDGSKPDGPRIRGGSQSSGWSVLGFNFGGSTTLSIDIPVSADCFGTLEVDTDWPPTTPACDPALPIDGTITSLDPGALPGPRVIVEISASKDCYTVAAGGAPWPTGLPQCASEEAGAAG